MALTIDDIYEAKRKMEENNDNFKKRITNFGEQAGYAANMMNHMHKIITTHLMPTKKVQFRFPKSKKKRIQKKWRKNTNNWKEVFTNEIIYHPLHDSFIMSPEQAEKLKKRLDEFNSIQR